MDYKEKLRLAKEALDSGSYDKETIEYIFHELAESEGEQHRKWILEYLYDGLRKSDEQFKDQFKVAIAWFEKQGEQNHTVEEVLIKAGLKPYKDGDQWCVLLGDNIQEGICGFGNTIEDALYAFLKDLIASQDKQKSVKVPKFKAGDIIRHKKQGFTCKIIAVDTEAEEYKLSECNGTHIPFYFQDAYELVERKSAEVEPRFKVGDWVVFNDKHESVYQIKKIENFQYTLRHILGGSMPLSFSHEDMIRAWTINDAKDGDVLVEDSCIFILKEMVNDFHAAITYCTLFDDGEFHDGETLYFDIDSTRPATQEQRDLLFQKMKEVGYEWNADKKELKKIEQKSWGEKDEKYLKLAIENFQTLGNSFLTSWLKSLKDRVQPKQDSTDRFFEGFKKGEQSVIENYGKYGLYKLTEWSEEDKNRVDQICEDLKCGLINFYANKNVKGLHFDEIIESNIDWLKNKLKYLRPQTTWKPSDEQIKTCKEVYADILSAKGFDLGTVNNELNRLEEQLKKLREE